MPYDYAKMSANQAEKYLSDVEVVTLDNADQVFAALAAMKEKNELEFMSYLKDLGVVDQKDHFEVAGPREFLREVDQNVRNSTKSLKRADPIYIRSSKQYKGLLAASEEAEAGMKKLWEDHMGDHVTPKELEGILDLADNLQEKADDYTAYKTNALGGKKPNELESSRMAAAYYSHVMADDMRRKVRQKTLEMEPDLASSVMKFQIRPKDGAYTKQQVAEFCYIETMENKAKKDPNFDLKKALDFDTMREGVKKLTEDPVFQSFADKVGKLADGHTQAEASTAFYANFVDFKLKNKAPQQQEQAKQPAEPQKDALSNNPKAPNGPLFNM